MTSALNQVTENRQEDQGLPTSSPQIRFCCGFGRRGEDCLCSDARLGEERERELGEKCEVYGRRVNALAVNIQEMIILYLYGGWRREGDVPHHVLQQTVDGPFQVWTLAVDICISSKCDLTMPGAVEFWEGHVLSGRVIAGGAGPPCESLSAAGHSPGGPPPLRGGNMLWGLAPRQQKQIDLGNCLLMGALRILLALAIMGGAGFLEHPLWRHGCSTCSRRLSGSWRR